MYHNPESFDSVPLLAKGEMEVWSSTVGEPSDGVTWFCCADKGLSLFEMQYPLPDGMTYDSYIIKDEKLVVMDTVDHAVEAVWLDSVRRFLASRGGREPDYIVVQHLEPDHSAAIEGFMNTYASCKLVCSVKAAAMLRQFAAMVAHDRVIAVKDGEGLDIGSRKLRFAMAPMVHWPEVMVTYDPKARILFSADAFGTFGCGLAARVARGDDAADVLSQGWSDEARRYYINICGKYGPQVQSLLKKAAAFDLAYLCPLHGPVLKLEDFNPLPLYGVWSAYEPQHPEKVLILAASLHGNTVEAAVRLGEIFSENGIEADVLDLSEADLSEAVSRAFAYGATIFMSATYDASLVPSMQSMLNRLKSKHWQRRVAGIVENGSWAPIAGKLMAKELEEMKGIEVACPVVSIRTRMDASSEEALRQLALDIASRLRKN